MIRNAALFVFLLFSCSLFISNAAPEEEGILTSTEIEPEIESLPPSTVELTDGFLPASASVPWSVDGFEETISLAPEEGEEEESANAVPSVLADIPVLSAEDVNVSEETDSVVLPETTDEVVLPEEIMFADDPVEAAEEAPVEIADFEAETFIEDPVVSTIVLDDADVIEDVEREDVLGQVVDDVVSVFQEENSVEPEDIETVVTDVPVLPVLPLTDSEPIVLNVPSTVEGEEQPTDVMSSVPEGGEEPTGDVHVALPSVMEEVEEGSDPREGVCTENELDSVKNYFTTHEHECTAYSCVESKTQEFFDALNLNYHHLWQEGGDSDTISTAASLLAACVCRCDMMKCEVDYMKKHASANCFDATVDYCSAQNDLFVERCSAAADEYKLVTDTVGQDARWKSLCPGSCRPSDPVDGLALPTSSGETPETVSAGEAEEPFEFSLESVGLSGADSGALRKTGGVSGLLAASMLALWLFL